MGLRIALLAIGVCVAGSAVGQVMVTGEVTLTGTVETVTAEGLTIRDPDGGRHQVRVQGKKQQGIALADGSLLAAPVEVSVRAEFPATGLQPGQVVRFRCLMASDGKAESAATGLVALDGGKVALGVSDVARAPAADAKPPAGRKQAVEREITASVKKVDSKILVVDLSRGKAWNGKMVLRVPLAAGAVVRLTSDDWARIEPGARVWSRDSWPATSPSLPRVRSTTTTGPRRSAVARGCASIPAMARSGRPGSTPAATMA